MNKKMCMHFEYENHELLQDWYILSGSVLQVLTALHLAGIVDTAWH